MKKNDIKELHTKSKEELIKLLKEERNGIGKLKMDLKMGKLKNTNLIHMKNKDIARMFTIIKQKEVSK